MNKRFFLLFLFLFLGLFSFALGEEVDPQTLKLKEALPYITANADGSVQIAPPAEYLHLSAVNLATLATHIKLDYYAYQYFPKGGESFTNPIVVQKLPSGLWQSSVPNGFTNPATGITTLPAQLLEPFEYVLATMQRADGTTFPALADAKPQVSPTPRQGEMEEEVVLAKLGTHVRKIKTKFNASIFPSPGFLFLRADALMQTPFMERFSVWFEDDNFTHLNPTGNYTLYLPLLSNKTIKVGVFCNGTSLPYVVEDGYAIVSTNQTGFFEIRYDNPSKTKIIAPKTGDATNILLIVSLFVFSATFACLLLFHRKLFGLK